eukprot:TRINITY_DN793_c0_g3_i1.p1 TRINITY_DN793_c0_g3~~TRINITY_DN793_c0_g3_i1.p1  ORF type:complete len:326 (+),score=58.20 TRINITY_DN793_c0_g3_i1:2039-3016(+)
MTPHNAPFSVLTFNLLAPPYKRLPTRNAQDARERERDHDAMWQARFDTILHMLQTLSPAPAVISLQEVWFHKPLLDKLEATFSAYYHIFYARRPHKEDGLATLVSKDTSLFRDVRHVNTFLLSDASFNGTCDRIALAVSAEVVPPSANSGAASKLLLVNTHLTFPHSFIPAKMREMQACVLTTFVNRFSKSSTLPVVSLVMGDFNSDLTSSVCQNILSQRFVSCYQQLQGDSAPVTHLNHRRQHVFVDHVFLRHGGGNERSASPVSVVKEGANTLVKEDCVALVPVETFVYPRQLPTHCFPSEFKLSDHRPVAISFERVLSRAWH